MRAVSAREARKSADGRDSGGLGRIDVLGGSYAFNEQLTASLYASENKNVAAKRFGAHQIRAAATGRA